MSDSKPATWFWIAAVVVLLWNLIGLAMYAMQVVMFDQVIENMPEDMKDLLLASPSWVNWTNAIAVISGALGGLLLVMRRSLSLPLLVISMLAVWIFSGYWAFGTNSLSIVPMFNKVMTFLVPILALVWVVVAMKANNAGWLR